MTAAFEAIPDVQCQLAESPVWLPGERVLVFVDITGRRLHRFTPASGALESFAIEEDIGCVAPAKGGGYVAGLRSGIWLLDERGAKVRCLAANPENPATSRFNDGRVDPRGRLIAGTVDEPKAGGNANLYRCDRRGLTRLSTGYLTTNGVAFSPDGRTLYHSDTPRFVIYRYDYDAATGAAENRRVFVQIEPTATDRGRPDGAAMDSEGCYWSAQYEGARVHRYDPDGKLISSHPVPARNVTMPAFGGDDMKTLFVTTAREKSGAGGHVYAMRVDVAGVASPPFDPEV
ncbi:MAG TPA: SMP-30/gluconolactonase/LRE family protein [Steroidobacteraceae bacterium]|nr:SMP-30/gluconolactonase/LRE family protein [Steroidobacteraceae bacterium]